MKLSLMPDSNLDFQLIIADLQTKIAFLDDTVEQLNHIVAKQSQQIADQAKQLQLLYQKIDNQKLDNFIQPFDLIADKPPHY